MKATDTELLKLHALRAFRTHVHGLSFSAQDYDGQLAIAQLCRLNNPHAADALREAINESGNGQDVIDALIGEALDVHASPVLFLQHYRDMLLNYFLECAIHQDWNVTQMAVPRDPLSVVEVA